MKLLLCLALSLPLFSQTPTFVQWTNGPNSAGTSTSWGTCCKYTIELPEPTDAGDSIAVGFQHDNTGAPTITIADNQTNTWSALQCTHVDANSNRSGTFYASNVAASTKCITLTLSSQVGFVSAAAGVFFNAGAIDTAGCKANDATGTSITTGAYTPTVTGDLVVQFSFFGGNPAANGATTASFTVGSQGNITWHLGHADRYSAMGGQYGVYNSTASLNPTFTTGTSIAWSSQSLFIKAASSGGAPARAFRRLHVSHQQMPTGHVNPFTTGFPSAGNLIVVNFNGGGDTISSITSSPSCTWAQTGAAGGSGNAVAHIYYSAGCASESLVLTITMSANTNDGTFMLYDFTGAAASPFGADSGTGQAGNQASLPTSFTSCSACFTPGNTNGVVIMTAVWANCTGTDITAPASSLFDADTYNGNSVDGPQMVDQNNALGIFYNSTNATITVTWSTSCGAANLGEWGGKVASFNAAAAASSAPTRSLLGVGK